MKKTAPEKQEKVKSVKKKQSKKKGGTYQTTGRSEEKKLALEEIPSDQYWRRQAYVWRIRMDELQHGYVYVVGKLNDKEFLDEMLKTKKSLSEMFEDDQNFAAQYHDLPGLNLMVEAFSDSLEHILQSGRIRNPQLAESNRIKADAFAKNMGKHLKAVRKEGITSTRKIADRFNELDIKSFRGSRWSHNQVSVLIRRRKELGLEGGEGKSLTAE